MHQNSISMKGNKNKLGFKYSDEQKAKIKEQKRIKGFKGPTHGKKIHSEEYKKELKVKAKNNDFGSRFKTKGKFGKDSGNWKGGAEGWVKQQVLNRDDYICQICGLRDEFIAEVDHKKPKSIYPESAKDINNLWVLCPNCHRRKTNQEKLEIIRIKRNKINE